MSNETIVRFCSPTLAGIKTGSLFSDFFGSKEEMNESIRRWNHIFVKKGLRMIPLKYDAGRALIYLFRISQLRRDLCDCRVSHLLTNRGYTVMQPDRCILCLMKRLAAADEFPHEIGLFLGYPPEDVCGFIEHKARGYKCICQWKVYGDADAAQKLSAKYKKCTSVYCRQYAYGKTIERLTVAG